MKKENVRDVLSHHQQHSTTTVCFKKRSTAWQVKQARASTYFYSQSMEGSFSTLLLCTTQLQFPFSVLRSISILHCNFYKGITYARGIPHPSFLVLSSILAIFCISLVFLSGPFLSLGGGGGEKKTALFLYILPFIRSFYWSCRNSLYLCSYHLDSYFHRQWQLAGESQFPARFYKKEISNIFSLVFIHSVDLQKREKPKPTHFYRLTIILYSGTGTRQQISKGAGKGCAGRKVGKCGIIIVTDKH